jgi:hypothetical protein
MIEIQHPVCLTTATQRKKQLFEVDLQLIKHQKSNQREPMSAQILEKDKEREIER